MSQPGAPSRTRAALPVVVPLLLGIALSALLVSDRQDRQRLAADSKVRAAVAAAAATVSDSIRSQLTQAAAGPVAGDRTIPVHGSGPSEDRLIEARDSGLPVLDDQGGAASILVPVFDPRLPVLTTAERRRALLSYRVAPLALLPVLDDAAPDGGGMLVRSPRGSAVIRTGAVPGSIRSYAIDAGVSHQPGWLLEAWVPSPGLPSGTWLEVLGVLGGAALAAAFLGVVQRQSWVAARRSRDLERQRALVTGLAPVVQTSLDLAEVVPAMATHLVEGLGLRGLGLSVPTETGERQLFTWGQAPDATALPVSPMPERLEPDETYTVPLTRGGRMLGLLRVVAGEPLGQHDLQSLTTASELLGSTLANAEAFTRQQVLVERMRSVDELKTIFLATASHELRTPVTAIVGFSGILLQQQETLTPEQTRQFLERVLSNAKGLEGLIEQLLDFSRLERGMHPGGDEVLNLGERVQQILEVQTGVYAGHQLRCSVDRACLVLGSAAAVERIVTNLVGNAAKYTPEGTTITVSVRAERDRCLLVVDDEGAGVPVADRERVFSRFFRGTSDTVASTRGAGIGLAIVAEYAASMSATASVLTAPSGGARFLVSFPMAAEKDVLGGQHAASS